MDAWNSLGAQHSSNNLQAESRRYVRRSRRRFWQSEHDDSKLAAYQTLYYVLTTLSRLLAPFIPFIAEELHQQLVRPFAPDAAESVHLTPYPVYDDTLADEGLERAMDLTRRVVSLGHAARKESKVRVRQPLKRITLISHEDGVAEAVSRHEDIILDELNVKAIDWAENEEDFISYEYKPVFKEIGPRFGKYAKDVAAWIGENASEITHQLEAHRAADGKSWIELKLSGSTVTLDETCLEVHLREKPETVAQREGQLLLVLDTHIDPALHAEGLAREIVNRIQTERKQQNLDYTDRIHLTYSASDELQAAIGEYHIYITKETLSVEVERVDGCVPGVEAMEIDGMSFSFAIRRI